MKRRLACMLLALAICVTTMGSTFAMGKDEFDPIQPMGAITLTASLSKTRATATIKTTSSESLSVSFTLYRISNGSEVYVTSGSNSGNGTIVTASKSVSLSSGTYKMYYSGSGDATSASRSKTFSI